MAPLKAMIRAQHAHSKARHEQYTATLNFRASEIARLKLLLDKLQRMLFGAKSEKLVRQVTQLELQLEELETARRRRACDTSVVRTADLGGTEAALAPFAARAPPA